jgi:hypothetical protein
MPGQQHAGHARTITAADNRAEVARVGHAIDGNEEWWRRAVATQYFSKVSLGQFGSGCQHPLRGLAPRFLFQAASGDVHDRHTLALCDSDDVVDPCITFEFGTDPDLVDLTAPTDEHLTDRLTAFDLSTSETFGRTRAARRTIIASIPTGPCASRTRRAAPCSTGT